MPLHTAVVETNSAQHIPSIEHVGRRGGEQRGGGGSGGDDGYNFGLAQSND